MAANPQLTARVEPDFAARVDAIQEELNRKPEQAVRRLERTDVVRLLIGRGVDVVERELGITPKAAASAPPPAPPRKRAR